jgi:hypothetical protein
MALPVKGEEGTLRTKHQNLFTYLCRVEMGLEVVLDDVVGREVDQVFDEAEDRPELSEHQQVRLLDLAVASWQDRLELWRFGELEMRLSQM